MTARAKKRKLPVSAFGVDDGMGSYVVTYLPASTIDRGASRGYLESLVRQGVSVVVTTGRPVAVTYDLIAQGGRILWLPRPLAKN